MSTPTGFYYYPKAIPEELTERLATFLEQECEWFPIPEDTRKARAFARQMAHYGYTDKATGEPTPDFPPVLEELCALVYTTHDGLSEPYCFDKCIINRYLSGQDIGLQYTREEYACFTLGSGAEIEFTDRGRMATRSLPQQKYALNVEPQSLYIISRNWVHRQRPRKLDPDHPVRGVRWSLTFRSVK